MTPPDPVLIPYREILDINDIGSINVRANACNVFASSVILVRPPNSSSIFFDELN